MALDARPTERTFRLTAIADRIEVDRQGQAYVFDYKTGAPPSNKQVKVGWSPQLTLEAAMIEAGAFAEVGARQCRRRRLYRTAKRRQDTMARHGTTRASPTSSRRIARSSSSSSRSFAMKTTPYASRPHPAFLSDVGDYDHLARVKEWMRGGGEPA